MDIELSFLALGSDADDDHKVCDITPYAHRGERGNYVPNRATEAPRRIGQYDPLESSTKVLTILPH
jgi:hypothetical protein